MRTFLLTIFWITNIGNVVQLIVMFTAGWVLFSGAYTFSDLNVSVFVTQIVSWLQWLETLLIAVFGELGEWILSIPILILAPVKFVAGIFIGVWAYTAAYNLPTGPANT